jgi:hypothetical protein
VIVFFYPVLFEVLGNGRTPGKRMSHLRVVRDTGSPVDLAASAIRNLMRLIDGPILLYLPSMVSVAVTSRNQRPGDLAAGTLVIREQSVKRRAAAGREASAGGAAARWDASAVTVQETAAVRRFLERRDSLERSARTELAQRLADGLRAKVTSAPRDLEPERFLEELERVKRNG